MFRCANTIIYIQGIPGSYGYICIYIYLVKNKCQHIQGNNIYIYLIIIYYIMIKADFLV